MSDTKQYKSHSQFGRLLVFVFCVVVAGLLFINRQYVVDQLSVWQYQPSSDIILLANRSDMSNKGKFYFYASQPSLQNATNFNKKCTRKEDSTAILGCYNGRNIYIYNVTDAQLDGIREVTAAHEMLHAAYDRLEEREKQSINTLLEAEYDKQKNDKDFATRMAFYARTEPDGRGNELHSVIGTEVANISPELEAHYGKYFNERSKVIALHVKYASVFNQLQTRSDELSAQLMELGDKIEEESINYNKEVTELNTNIENFNAQARSGEFATQEEFQTERGELTQHVRQLDARRTTINDKVAEYESLRQELTGIASQSAALNRSIDSSLAPAPSL